MKKALKRTIVAAVVAIAAAGSVAGALAASATVSHKANPAVEKIAATDTDTVQSGDQHSPDVGGEAGSSNDGPGGWQDPPGVDINNEQSGSN